MTDQEPASSISVEVTTEAEAVDVKPQRRLRLNRSLTSDINGKAATDPEKSKKIIKITFGNPSAEDEAATGTSKKVTLKRSSSSSSQNADKTPSVAADPPRKKKYTPITWP